MEDEGIHNRIEQLVAEEQDLYERGAEGGLSESEHRRLESIKVGLDQCWDLLRQRRALREAGYDAGAAAFATQRSWSATSSERVPKTLTIVGLGGSLASNSKSRAALQSALEGAARAGAETRLLDIRRLDLPMYNPDDDEPSEAAARLIESCYVADGLLWSSPMYQGTISGALKNALDWLHLLGDRDPPFLHDKVIGLISAAGGTQGLQAINTMEFAVRALRGWAVPYVVPVAAAARVFNSAGQIQDQAVELQLKTLGEEVVRVADRFVADVSLHREAECAHAADRVATVA
jgi:FMN reductase